MARILSRWCYHAPMSPAPAFHPAYFTVRFRCSEPHPAWPAEFAIISAQATTGESWSPEQNQAADRALAAHLSKLRPRHTRITGYSPTTLHAEASWAVELSVSRASDLGAKFRQDAIYIVRAGELVVVSCDDNREQQVGG